MLCRAKRKVTIQLVAVFSSAYGGCQGSVLRVGPAGQDLHVLKEVPFSPAGFNPSRRNSEAMWSVAIWSSLLHRCDPARSGEAERRYLL